jgi:hypothetical protein
MTHPPNATSQLAPIDWHRERAQDSARRAAAVSAAGRRIGRYRLLAFALFGLAIVWAVIATPMLWLWWPDVVLSLGAFIALVAMHRRNRAAFAALDHRRIYHERAVHRIAREWSALPVPRIAVDLADHPYASDLAITGSASILQLVDVASSAPGRPTLLDWLLGPPPPAATIDARQRAVRELAARDDVRVELGVLAIGVGELSPQTLERFYEWCDAEGSLADRRGVVWSARALTVSIVAASLLQAIGVLAHPYWLGVVLLARGFRSLARRRARESGTIPTISFAALGGHRAMLELAAGSAFESPLLTSLTARLREGSGAGPALARVERIAVWAEVRHSPMLHFALDWLLLWDFHVGVAFDAWKRSAGRHVRRWLETLGEIEALAALSTLAHDQPGWSFPETRETGAVMIEAEGLAHPLIADAQRVANDIAVGPTGTFLLITGSNMSGKSTLLRAIGANCVLAQAGGPVCAAPYRAHIVRIQTSMRIEDSLADGVSLFMAELHRIKRVVDAARERAPGEPPVLYLFDEVLHGTNSSERRVAARTVLGHLLSAGAIGAITSHDLSLAADGEIEKAARCVSFADSIDRGGGTPVLHFDYRLRQGLATSTNALALLDIVGLGADSHP